MYDRMIARHEAAHFVVAWALECPYTSVDITPNARKGSRLAYNGNGAGGSNFSEIIIDLAGPVADGWEKTNEEIVLDGKYWIAPYIATFVDSKDLPVFDKDEDMADWEQTLERLLYSGIDIQIPTSFTPAVNWCLNATRSILTECRDQWKEVEDYLVEHGRIGFGGKYYDLGEEATYRFFAHWEDDDGIPENVRVCVERLRREFYEFAHETIYENVAPKSDGKTSTATDML